MASMIEEGRGFSGPLTLRAARAWATLVTIGVATVGGGAARAADRAVRLSEATELGTFNVGPARADVRRAPDREGAGDVLKLEYTIPRGAAAGLYAKSFPGGLDPERVDAVRLAVRAEGPDQSRGI